MALSEKDKQLLADEKFDPRKVILACPLHSYFGPETGKSAGIALVRKTGKMDAACKTCWMVYYTCALSMVPPSERAQRLEEMTEVVRDCNQAVEQGKWDYEPLARPEVHIEKGNN